MTDVTPFRHEDADDVAALFQSVFRDPTRAAPDSLSAYLRWLYLDMPGSDPAICSLVHRDRSGKLNGFLGVTVMRMRHGSRHLKAAVCGSLMVEKENSDAMTAPRMLKSFLAGPQDISFSETAGEASRRMWVGLRGHLLPSYSLDWVRVLRPASFLAQLASQRFRPLGALTPIARGIDALRIRRMAVGELRWSALPPDFPVQGGLSVTRLDAPSFVSLVEPLTTQFPIRPEWQAGQLEAVISDAAKKPSLGEFVLCEVSRKNGGPVGGFAYHLKEGGIAHVLQVLSEPKATGWVLDHLIRDAAERGACAIRGRVQPALLEAMLGRRIGFTHMASSVVHSRDPALLDACLAGQVFFNGLSGEHWNRLNGGSFD